MAATTFEDRLARLAADGPAAMAPRTAPPQPKVVTQKITLDASEDSAGLKTLLSCFGGGLLGLILATIISIGMIHGSPWGPGSQVAHVVMWPTFAVTLLLIIALIPTTIFFRRAHKSFAFVASALTVLMIGFLI